jgi:acetolactate synthase-1/2/3 large subunit
MTVSQTLNKQQIQEFADRSRFEAGDLITHFLEQLGVKHIFGVPGGAIEPLYNAIARSARRGGIQPIVARHESGAAFMADGYARETGNIGVCCSTAGPGATNMITGIASAYQDHIPLLVITAQTGLRTFGRGAVQESSCTGINTVSMMQYCTRYNTLVSHPDQLERKLVNALMTAMRHPRGPAHLSIPLDIMRQPVPAQGNFNLPRLLNRPSVFFEETQEIYDLLCRSRQTVFFVGAGAGPAAGIIAEIALLLDAQIVTSPQGKGLISPYHPNYRGVFGLAGHESAFEAVKHPDVDLIVAVGTDFDEQASNGWDTGLLNHKLVHVDASSENFHGSLEAQLHVHGEPARVFKAIKTRLYENQNPPQLKTKQQRRYSSAVKDKLTLISTETLPPASDAQEFYRRSGVEFADLEKAENLAAPIKPQRLMYELSKRFPLGTRFFADIGNSFLWAIHYLLPFDRRIAGERKHSSSTFHTSMGFASMGWSIGAAVGAAVAKPKQPVVCIVGDGSMLMSGNEITTAVQEKLPVICVILNDSALGTVKHGQRMTGAEPIAHELPQVSFHEMAEAMGARGIRVESAADLHNIDIAELCAQAGPTVIDVLIDGEERPPFGTRMKVLQSAPVE